jgi:hypothetical protein
MAPLSMAPPATNQVTWGNLRVRALELAIEFKGNRSSKEITDVAEEFLRFLQGK